MMYDYKKDLNNPTYDDGSHTKINHGSKIWLNDKGQWHREDDKPAWIWSDGAIQWWINGKTHREDDKPAIIWSNGSMFWYINSKKHRENNKPATINYYGYREWWINDELIEPELKHMIAAIEEDPEFINNEQFIGFIKDNKEDIPLKDQELILKHNPRLAEYISNLDPKFKRTKQAVSFGLFE